ncbi:dTDP-4-dehydrorhamnose reductase [Bacillus sp. AGMB 02131]|uniref:dTDP-4-dehydrorhamnose reductase n=1 Tax=Peribacillus faecalis TaxID=2772559 RepID=A0A927HCK9_9BACI|nr:dTDP-4-dehydrorhamnose reductase [Peribacillus faecalis]MBD3109671.1 dTDP-4-dehydrorhamnose reductase [Peribacillus faecalis]
MKIIITGAEGQLGKEIVALLSKNDNDVFPYAKKELDITKRDEIERICACIKPDLIINCAALTKVDDCETEVEKAYLVNGLGPYYLGKAANVHKAKLVHISTDYVFSGDQSFPYNESDRTNPQTIYGKSKLMGEELLLKVCNNVLIVRTSWLYGHDTNNFVRTMMELSNKKASISVVNDQFGSPSYTLDIAQTICAIMEEKTGIYHITNSGECSWYDFAKEIMKLTGKSTVIVPISTGQYQFKTPRPHYSVLAHRKLEEDGIKMRDWQSALSYFISKEYSRHEESTREK